MSATNIPVVTHPEKCRAETVEAFLARGGRIERIEAHPDPDGRVLPRGARDSRSRPWVQLDPSRRLS